MTNLNKIWLSFFILCTICVLLTGWSATLDARNTRLERQILIDKAERQLDMQMLEEYDDRLDSLQHIIDRTHTVTATVYYPTGNEMRSGKAIPVHYTLYKTHTRYIAISQDLWVVNGGPYSFGDSIRVVGTPYDGIYVVEDTMNKRHKNRVDILVSGKINEQWHNVKIYKV